MSIQPHAVVRRTAVAVGAAAALLLSLSSFSAPSATANELPGNIDAGAATLAGPMLVLGEAPTTWDKWARRSFTYGGVKLSPVATSTPSAKQYAFVTYTLRRQAGGIRTTMTSRTDMAVLNLGSVVTLPKYSYTQEANAGRGSTYSIGISIAYYADSAKTKLLRQSLLIANSSADYQCGPGVWFDSCTASLYGIVN